MSLRADVFGSEAADFYRFSFPQRRSGLNADALRLERKMDLVFEVVIPAHGLLFRAIRVDDRFVLDSLFPNGIFSAFGHRAAKVLPGYC